ncbi:MAG: hypothetical protein WC378_14550, partial [Opitutaceae bacterium]
MSSSFLESLKSCPTAPRAVLLSDACFFTRCIPVEEGAAQGQVAAQVELALEGLSPFPLPQLYFGHYWVPGSRCALVFASYRRRFTQDQVQSWSGVEWVVPSFCSVIGMPVSGRTTVLYPSNDSMTAVHWDGSHVPVGVTIVPLPTEATPDDLAKARDGLLRGIGDAGHVIDLPSVPAIASSHDEDSYRIQAGTKSFALPTAFASGMDVRPREDIAFLRQARKRQLILWRICLGLAFSLMILCLGELFLAAGWSYQRTRKSQAQTQQPVVEKVMTAQSLAYRIEELSSQRLLPFEMITLLSEKKPRTIQFVRTSTTGLRSIRVEAQTGNAADVANWQSTLSTHPSIESIEVRDLSSRDNLT